MADSWTRCWWSEVLHQTHLLSKFLWLCLIHFQRHVCKVFSAWCMVHMYKAISMYSDTMCFYLYVCENNVIIGNVTFVQAAVAGYFDRYFPSLAIYLKWWLLLSIWSGSRGQRGAGDCETGSASAFTHKWQLKYYALSPDVS